METEAQTGTNSTQRADREPGAEAVRELAVLLRPVERRFALLLIVSVGGSVLAGAFFRVLWGAGFGPTLAMLVLSLVVLLVTLRKVMLPATMRRTRLAFELWLERHKLEERDVRRSLRDTERFRMLRAVPRTPVAAIPNPEGE